jgi:sulfate transport system ATP-binding protein
MSLVVDNISKRFARFPALKGVSLTAEPGEFLALLGPSGSGKTTLLRVVAGLETPDAGTVVFDSQDFLAMSARERRIGMVFQHYALFRHMTVARNIAFGLKVAPAKSRPGRAAIEATVTRLLSLIQLEGFGERYPAQLSGGQQQRVALARALAIEPRMLLLDEPFGALDAKVRKDLRHWLRRVHDATGITTIFVTHDQEEAMDLADRVAVLREGRIEQVGAPAELEAAPASAFVFDFLGDSNQLACQVADGRASFEGFDAPAVIQNGVDGQATAWFRPHETTLEREGAGLAVKVTSVAAKGAAVRLACRSADGAIFEAEYPRDAPEAGLAVGSDVRLGARRVFVFGEPKEKSPAQ